jgi:hypothetical protein
LVGETGESKRRERSVLCEEEEQEQEGAVVEVGLGWGPARIRGTASLQR